MSRKSAETPKEVAMPAAGLRRPVSDLLFRQERGSQEEAAMPARETERYDSRNWLYAST